ncbi:hypothetical protein JRI60_07700 [Archangium violaceum]|uniref:hypothetical protein n=1 Tax=Archangium violaceum TaxID=83451 RepID=UPI001952604B|nr:hypothetical protein [Archangium violaceum]QRN98906.1 hypothetical protein JRI60_07700 [Archangium violaceum]
MSKVTNQPSGVVAGTLDISNSTEPDVASPTDAGAVLSRRKVAATRAKKAAPRAKKPVARRVTKTSNARQKR